MLASTPSPSQLRAADDGEELKRQLARSLHDLNNLLAAVSGYSQLLEADASVPEALRRPIQIVSAESKRAAAIVADLMAMARRMNLPAGSFVSGQTAPPGVPTAADARIPASSARVRPGAARILVIDDEEPVIMLISEILAQGGHEVEAAYSGAEALALLGAEEFDLILSDVRMPALGGPSFFDVLRTSRADLLNRVIFVTGDTVSASSREFFQRAGRPVLGKPFDPERLLELVNETLAGR